MSTILVIDRDGRLDCASTDLAAEGHTVLLCDVTSRLWKALNGLRLDYVVIERGALAIEETLLREPIARHSHVAVIEDARLVVAMVRECVAADAREERQWRARSGSSTRQR